MNTTDVAIALVAILLVAVGYGAAYLIHRKRIAPPRDATGKFVKHDDA